MPSPEDRGAAVARIFREHNRKLVGLLVTRLKNEQEAKEVAQEAYVKVLQLEPGRGAVSYLRSYLFKVAENLAIDRLRQRSGSFRSPPTVCHGSCMRRRTPIGTTSRCVLQLTVTSRIERYSSPPRRRRCIRAWLMTSSIASRSSSSTNTCGKRRIRRCCPASSAIATPACSRTRCNGRSRSAHSPPRKGSAANSRWKNLTTIS